MSDPQPMPLVWMDLEMTGLNPDTDAIIEIATVITDNELNTIATGPELILHQPASRFEKMDDWNQKQHTDSGLWEQVVASKVSVAEAEAQTLAFIKAHVGVQQSPLCGNSIWQDRRFIARYMPRIDEYLHYRMIDVSTVKELAKRWYPDDESLIEKNGAHRALGDILESIAELKFYRERFFRK